MKVLKPLLAKIKILVKDLEGILNNKIPNESREIYHLLILSSHWIYYNLIFSEMLINSFKRKIRRELKKELRLSPAYTNSKIITDKFLIHIYSHFFIIIDIGSRLSFPIINIPIDDKYLKFLYLNPFNFLKKGIKQNKVLINYDKKIIGSIEEVRNFRNNLIHYWTWNSYLIPSKKQFNFFIPKFYRENKGINLVREKGVDYINLRDFKTGVIQKLKQDPNELPLIKLNKMVDNDFKAIQRYIDIFLDGSLKNLKNWINKLDTYYK